MPSIGGATAATIVGWMIDGALQPFLGTGVTLALSFTVSTVVFFFVQRWLRDLRDG